MVNDQIVRLIDHGIKVRQSKEKSRQYLGGSIIGSECQRRIWFMYKGYQGKVAPHIQRIFDVGHKLEDLMIKWLEDAGFIIKGTQLRWEYLDGKFKGHLDGVIVDGLAVEGLTYPCLLEIKTANAANYKQVVMHGVEKAKPIYAAQMAVYQTFAPDLELWKRPALIGVMCKDGVPTFRPKRKDAGIYFEAVEFNTHLAQEMVERAHNIAEAKSEIELPRCNDKLSYPCTFCEFKDRCY